jgi:hypothetical protein
MLAEMVAGMTPADTRKISSVYLRGIAVSRAGAAVRSSN